MTKVVGMSYTINDTGARKSTLYVMPEFDDYYNDSEGKRGSVGHKVETIYVGEYDVTNLKPGMVIEVSYGKAVSTRNGIYQPIQKIDVVSNSKQQT